MFDTKTANTPSKSKCGCGRCASCATAARGPRAEPRARPPAAPAAPVRHRDRAAAASSFGYAAPARGPRMDGADDAPFRGPDAGAPAPAQVVPPLLQAPPARCTFSPIRVETSGGLAGGWTVNDYLSGGTTWGAVPSPGTAGAAGRRFKVQLHTTYGNNAGIGVSQTMTHGGSNQAFLDGTAAYLGRAAGSVTNGTTFNEPVLNAGDPYASTGWNVLAGERGGGGDPALVSFADVPGCGPGEKGYIDFHTCFYARDVPCQASVCKTWRWTVDFTGTSTVNTVT